MLITFAVKNVDARLLVLSKSGRRDFLPAKHGEVDWSVALSFSSARQVNVELAVQVSRALLSKANALSEVTRGLHWTGLTRSVDGETRRKEAIVASGVRAINRQFELQRLDDAAPNGDIPMFGC